MLLSETIFSILKSLPSLKIAVWESAEIALFAQLLILLNLLKWLTLFKLLDLLKLFNLMKLLKQVVRVAWVV